jgi:hypothetical protein
LDRIAFCAALPAQPQACVLALYEGEVAAQAALLKACPMGKYVQKKPKTDMAQDHN